MIFDIGVMETPDFLLSPWEIFGMTSPKKIYNSYYDINLMISSTLISFFSSIVLNYVFYSISGGALDPGIDLLDALSLHTNLSQFQGVTVTQEYQHQRVFHLSG